MARFRGGILLISICFLLASAASLQAGDTGAIAGTVVAASDGKPLAFANVIILGTGMGTFAKENGRFIIKDIPPGAYTVKVMMMGFAPLSKENVAVTSGQTTELRFKLTETVVVEIPEVLVEAERPMVDTEKTQTKRGIKREDIAVRSINTVEDAIATQPGVVLDQGQIHVRGGRATEVKMFVDGIQISDPFVGSTSMEVAWASLSGVELLSGGFDAEYGNVQSGVVNLKTREGGTRYSGLVSYMTDDYGAPDRTYFNLDKVAVGLGGPIVVPNLRFYMSSEAFFSDTHLKTLEPRQQKELWGFIKYRERQRNRYSSQGKLTYFLSSMKKLSVEVLGSGEKYDYYSHTRSRVGYWSADNSHWWFEPLDSTYSLYAAPAHTPDVTNNHSSIKAVWNHTLTPSSFYSVRVGRYTTLYKQVVLDKQPFQYETPTSDESLDPENRYFVVRGDAPWWQRYHTTMWVGKGDLTIQRGKTHQFKVGGETNIYRVEMEDISYPSFQRPRGLLSDTYHFGCWSASAFLQDRIKLQGMNLRAGLRFDLFDPGKDAVLAYNRFIESTGFESYDASFLKRIEWQVSPRLGVSYPISERDALYFNYGYFYQVPRLEVLFRSLGVTTGLPIVFGNPLLDAETTIMYEIGIQHQFTRTLVGDVAMFYKDIFGLAGTEVARLKDGCDFIQRYGPLAGTTIYVNQDYGSVRGIEVALIKRFSRRFAASFVYTFSKATGSSSNELQGANVVTGGMDRTPITELPLEWDKNHVITANLRVAEPGLWGVNMDWSYSSGPPYTPMLPRERMRRAALLNSERLPSRITLDIKADKRWKIAGREIPLFVEALNVLDRKNVASLEPGPSSGNYVSYYTTTGELGGAYDYGELLGLPDVIYIPLHDPRVYGPPRCIRTGISFDW
jgi:outer membrane receptor protein involved in Fe transport